MWARAVAASAAAGGCVRVPARRLFGFAARPKSAAAAPQRPYVLQTKGRVTPLRAVPESIARPPYVITGSPPSSYPPPTIHDAAGQRRMRESCARARDVLDYACGLVEPGMTTEDIDRLVHEKCVSLGVYPSPLGYAGFPKSVCSSINEVICHGIPDADAVVRAGDIVKLDVSVYVGGVHGDTCRTVVAGGPAAIDAAGLKLVTDTKAFLDAAIAIVGPGLPVRQIGATIAPLARKAGYGIVECFAGHGIGETFHTEPLVHHQHNTSRMVLKEGMTFTIEPMITESPTASVRLWQDHWTAVTSDGSRCAQFEHTLLVTAHGADILTDYEGRGSNNVQPASSALAGGAGKPPLA